MNAHVITKQQAQAILDAIDVDMSNEEEVELLRSHNPPLFDAYQSLLRIAGHLP